MIRYGRCLDRRLVNLDDWQIAESDLTAHLSTPCHISGSHPNPVRRPIYLRADLMLASTPLAIKMWEPQTPPRQ